MIARDLKLLWRDLSEAWLRSGADDVPPEPVSERIVTLGDTTNVLWKEGRISYKPEP